MRPSLILLAVGMFIALIGAVYGNIARSREDAVNIRRGAIVTMIGNAVTIIGALAVIAAFLLSLMR